MVVGPDVKRARKLYKDDVLDARELRAIMSGASRWYGDQHRWDCHQLRIEGMLRSAGWRNVRSVNLMNLERTAGWPVASRVQWQCAALGRATR
jgi:hypothetical protein